jgi:SNF2 family DNA or RNA helicase
MPAITLEARLIDGPRIKVQQTGGFTNEAKIALRAISQDHEWDGKAMAWLYPYSPGALQGLQDASKQLRADLRMDDHLREQLDLVRAETANEMEVRKLIQKYLDDLSLPTAPYMTQPTPPPWAHQAISWHWGMRVRAFYLAGSPGIGKTRMAADLVRGKVNKQQVREPVQIDLDRRYSNVVYGKVLPQRTGIVGGVLVACPSGVTGEWVEQLFRWQNIRALSISGDATRKRKRAGTKAWVHVCGYESLESVEDNRYDMIIADEAHYLANAESNRWGRMNALRKHAANALALSGTPMSNMLQSLWSQFYWLDGGRTLGPSEAAYRQRYLAANIQDGLDAETRVSRAISRVTMFMTLQDAFPDKAQKIHQVIRVPMTDEQATYYEQLRNEAVVDIMAGQVDATMTMTKLTKMLQVTQGFVLDKEHVVQQFSSAKLKALEGMITGDGDLTDKRTIIWCRFTADVERISAMLDRHQIKHMKLVGGMMTSDKRKDEFKTAWNNDWTQRYLIGMISMGIGLNLNAPMCVNAKGKPDRCSHTIFYGLDWKVTQVEQAMDRIYRGDQPETCLYRYLLTEDVEAADGSIIKPIDVRIYECLQMKLKQGVDVKEETIRYVRYLLGAV